MSIHYIQELDGPMEGGETKKKEKHSCFQKTLGLDLCRKTVDFFIEKAQAALEFL